MDNKLWANAEYGKLRTCTYLPISIAKYGESGHIIPYTDKDGFDSKYVKSVLYNGVLSTEVAPEYKVDTGEKVLSRQTVSDKVMELARKIISEK